MCRKNRGKNCEREKTKKSKSIEKKQKIGHKAITQTFRKTGIHKRKGSSTKEMQTLWKPVASKAGCKNHEFARKRNWMKVKVKVVVSSARKVIR